MCRMEFEPEEEVVALPCKHLYHGECISQWLKDRKVGSLQHSDASHHSTFLGGTPHG